jgi:hypothetical protein
MMAVAFSALVSLSLLSATNSLAVCEAPWEKVFELRGKDRWISAVRAIGPDDLFVAGDWGVTRISKMGRERRETPGAPVLGLFVESPTSVYALGARELILHFAGQGWTEEHSTIQAKRVSRGEDELVSAFLLDEKGSSSLVAFGPDAALVRQPDGTWKTPSEAERYRLWSLGSMGPADTERPPRCTPGAWFWLARGRAWFTCQDRRTFTIQDGHVTANGTQPRECRAVTAVASAREQTYAVCADGQVWKAAAMAWQPVKPPTAKDTDYASIAVVDACVFLAGRRTVWRSCGR